MIVSHITRYGGTRKMKRISTGNRIERALTARQYTVLETLYDYCVYCGRPGDGVDHMPPISQFHTAKLLSKYLDDPPYLAIRCCWTCNRMLHVSQGKNWPHERCQELYSRYALKANVPVWTQEEIDELGYTLRTEIEAKQSRLIGTAGILPHLWARQRMLFLWKKHRGSVEELAALLLKPLSLAVPQPGKSAANRGRKKDEKER